MEGEALEELRRLLLVLDAWAFHAGEHEHPARKDPDWPANNRQQFGWAAGRPLMRKIMATAGMEVTGGEEESDD